LIHAPTPEKPIRGDQRLKLLKIHLSYWRDGQEHTPEGHDDADHWRIKALQEQDARPQTNCSTGAADVRGIEGQDCWPPSG